MHVNVSYLVSEACLVRNDAIDGGPDQREKTVFTALHIAEITEPCGIIVSPHIYILDRQKTESATILRQI
jgi:hypothetical protein